MPVCLSPSSTSHFPEPHFFLTSTALGHDKAQTIIDQITAAYEGGGPPAPAFGAFGGPAPPLFGGPPVGMPRK